MSFSASSLVASFFVSSVGFVLFEYGRRMRRGPQIGIGLVLMIFPYFVPGVWAMLGVAVVLVAILWFLLQQGM